MAYGLTAKQAAMLDVIRACMADGGSPPSVRELAARCGGKIIKSTHAGLVALAERGHIRRLPRAHRAIELLTPDRARGDGGASRDSRATNGQIEGPTHRRPIVTSIALSRLPTDVLVAELARRGVSGKGAAA